MTVADPGTAVLDVARWRGGDDGQLQHFAVPRRESQTVPDVVTHIQRHLDTTLAYRYPYRYACRVGMCGSCAMTVNGVARWTCRTHVTAVAPDHRLELRPLNHLPAVKDLVADMREFFDKWARARGRFSPSSTRAAAVAHVPPATAEPQAVDAAIECHSARRAGDVYTRGHRIRLLRREE